MSTDPIIEGYTLGVFQSNTYIAAARDGRTAVVIDPGEDADEVVLERLDALGLTVEAVLLTHGHIDHIWTAGPIADAASVPAFIHPEDQWLLADPGAALGAMGLGKWEVGLPSDIRPIADGDVLTYGGLTIGVRHTPGHTPGHCVFITDGIMFSGDLIFAGSVGRTDFPRGSLEDLMSSIRDVVLPMDDEVVIYPGHMGATTVGRERTTNPFVIADARGELPRLLGL
jgi:glyoxylase-like metal-dependent hydrolase (beta-lactamase superfamily II)